MHISPTALLSTLALVPFALPAAAARGQAAAPVTPPAAPSALLQPALTVVEDTLTSVKIEKWKKGSVRDEASANVSAMLSDLRTNLPPLITQADDAHGAISQSIPLIKHLDALYDVLLRIEEASRVSGPPDQIDQLLTALKKFESARIALYDTLQQNAAGQEKQVTDLQATLKARDEAAAREQAKTATSPAPCTPPKPAVKKRRPKTTTTPPATTKPAPQSPPKPQ